MKKYPIIFGVIAIIIGVALSLISLKIEALNWFAIPAFLGLAASNLLFGCDFLAMGWSAADTESVACKTTDGILSYVAIIISYLIVGMVIGWIYGKIKNRNQLGTTMN